MIVLIQFNDSVAMSQIINTKTTNLEFECR